MALDICRVLLWRAALIGYLLVREIPGESGCRMTTSSGLTRWGFLGFFLVLLSLLLLLKGSERGLSAISYVCLGVLVVMLAVFLVVENRVENPFIDFKLFKNSTLQGRRFRIFCSTRRLASLFRYHSEGADFDSAADGVSGLVGYGVTIVLFIRIGEKLMNRFGAPRKPMIWVFDCDGGDRSFDSDAYDGDDIYVHGGGGILPLRRGASPSRDNSSTSVSAEQLAEPSLGWVQGYTRRLPAVGLAFGLAWYRRHCSTRLKG